MDRLNEMDAFTVNDGQFIQPEPRVFIDYLVEHSRNKGNEVWQAQPCRMR